MARRRRRNKGINPLELIAGILILGVIVNVWRWYTENTETFWAWVVGILGASLIAVLSIWVIRKGIQKKKQNALPEKVREIKELLDVFSTDIPKYAKHTEIIYQIDFGRYLKEHMTSDEVIYEVEKEGTRPDIVINGTTAIEVKALKEPKNERNKRYNREHIDSIFKKIHTYKIYEKVIIVIFNSRYMEETDTMTYIQMKRAIAEEGVTLFEK